MLSERIRPGVEAAQWVIDEIVEIEDKLHAAYCEMHKIRPGIRAVFDYEVWDCVDKYVKYYTR